MYQRDGSQICFGQRHSAESEATMRKFGRQNSILHAQAAVATLNAVPLGVNNDAANFAVTESNELITDNKFDDSSA